MERSDSVSSFRSCHSEDDGSVSVGAGGYVCVTPPPVDGDGGSGPQALDSSIPLSPTAAAQPTTEPEPLVPERPSSRAETPRSFLLRRSGNKRRAPPPPTSPSPVPSVTGIAPSPVPSVTGIAPSPVPSVTGVAPSPVPSVTGGATSTVSPVTRTTPATDSPVTGEVITPLTEVTAPKSSSKAPPAPTSPSPVTSATGVTSPTTIHMKLHDIEPPNRLSRIVSRPVDTSQPNTVITVPCDVTHSKVLGSQAAQYPTGTVAPKGQQLSGVRPVTSPVIQIGHHTSGAPPPAPQRKDSLYIATTMAHTNWNIRLIDEESDTETTDSFVKVQPNIKSPVFTNSASSSLSRQSVGISPPMPTSAQPQNIIRPHPVTLATQQTIPVTPFVVPQVPTNQTNSGNHSMTQANENYFGIPPVQPSAFQPIQLVQQLAQLPAEQLLQLAQLQKEAVFQQPLSSQLVSQTVAPPIQSVPINSQSASLPKQSTTQENPARSFPELKIVEKDDFYENNEFHSDSGISSPTDSMMSNSGHVIRGRARQAKQMGLIHSASDPGISKQCHSRSPPQYPRYPGKSDLNDLVEEEDTVNMDDTLDGFIKATRSRPGLRRSDSNVTVAHLYEDILVSHRLKCKVTLTNLTVVVLLGAVLCPNTAIMLYTIFRLVFGTLFPAYYSYKAVKTKNVKEYVKWMMYWIVFAFFTCFETITDLFLSFWFPFYYELKILVVLWLLSPATRGSSILYRKFVHPWLTKREEDIDDCIAKAKQQGYSTVLQLGTKGVNYATTVLMQTAIKGGGGIVNQLRRSYSQGELNEGDLNRNVKALQHIDDDDLDGHYDTNSHISGTDEPRHLRTESDGGYKPRGSSASRVARNSGKTRSADVTEYYQDVSEDTVGRRRSPRTQDTGRSQPTLHFQEPPKGQQRRRGKSENRPRPKSMINAQDVARGAEWARAQRVGSTLSLTSEVEMSESSSHSSLASIPAAGNSQGTVGHSVRPKQRTGSTRRRVDSQGRKTSSISRSASRPNVPSTKTQQRSTLEVASDTE